MKVLRRYGRHAVAGLTGAGLTVPCLVSFVLQVVALVAALIVVGWLAVPLATALQRWVGRLSRRWAGARLGRKVVGAPAPGHERTFAGRSQEIVADATTWRELAWTLCHIPLGLVELVTFFLPWLGAWVSRADALLAARLLGYGVREDRYGGDPRPGEGRAPTSGGHGLIGMRERVEALGGTLQVGPTPEGGYAVRATIPLPSPAGVEGESS